MKLGVIITQTDLETVLLNGGFWEAAHAARTDFCLTIGSVIILLRGAGRWSGDGRSFGKEASR